MKFRNLHQRATPFHPWIFNRVQHWVSLELHAKIQDHIRSGMGEYVLQTTTQEIRRTRVDSLVSRSAVFQARHFAGNQNMLHGATWSIAIRRNAEVAHTEDIGDN